MIHLDSSFLVDLLRESGRGEEGPAQRWLQDHPEEELAISVYVACELYAGAELARDPERKREQVARVVASLRWSEPDQMFPLRYGQLFAELERQGKRASAMDLLIATAALGVPAPVLTRNAKDFERIPGLQVLGY